MRWPSPLWTAHSTSDEGTVTPEGGPRWRRVFEGFLETVVLSLMGSLVLVVLLGVSFRKAGAALVWYDEVAGILLAWLTFYGASLGALKRAHIGFPQIVASLSRPVRRAVILLGEFVVIAFFALTAWAGVRVIVVLGGDTLTSLPWMPLRVTQSVIPIGAVLYIVAQLLTLPERWKGAS